MKTIVLRSSNNQFFVEVKVDMISENQTFTIMSIEKRSDLEVQAGVDLKQLPTSVGEMKAYATANNLLMDIVSQSGTTNVVTSTTALSITSTGTQTGGTEDQVYFTQLEAAGGNGPITYEVTSGSLPAGLKLTPNGTIEGTPSAAGTSTFTVTVTDNFGQSDSDATINIVIAGA